MAQSDGQKAFAAGIDALKAEGMPVAFMETVLSDYFDVWITKSGNNVLHRLNIMRLSKSTMDDIKGATMDGRSHEVVGLQTAYHESTHAFIDLMEEKAPLKPIVASARDYYSRATRSDGHKVQDPYRALQESAATYVGHRAANYWWMHEHLLLLEEFTKEGTVIDPDIDFSSLTKIGQVYNRQMDDNLFGYEPYSSWRGGAQIELDVAIHPALKTYCDDVILEGKVKDTFLDYFTAGTTHRVRKIADRVNKLKGRTNWDPRSSSRYK